MLMISATLALAFLSFTGAMALLCFTRLSGIVFLGLPRDREINEKIKGKTADSDGYTGGFLSHCRSSSAIRLKGGVESGGNAV